MLERRGMAFGDERDSLAIEESEESRKALRKCGLKIVS